MFKYANDIYHANFYSGFLFFSCLGSSLPPQEPIAQPRPPHCALTIPENLEFPQVRKHFDDLYTLVTPGPSYPFLGISTTGVGVFWSCTLGVLFGLLVTPSVVERAGVEGGAAAVGVGFVTVFGCMFAVYATVKVCRIGRPRRRETPSDEWRKGR